MEPPGQSLVNWIPGAVTTKSHRQGGLKQQKSSDVRFVNKYVTWYLGFNRLMRQNDCVTRVWQSLTEQGTGEVLS